MHYRGEVVYETKSSLTKESRLKRRIRFSYKTERKCNWLNSVTGTRFDVKKEPMRSSMICTKELLTVW